MKKIEMLRAFFKMESASGVILLASAVIAFILANLPFASSFELGLSAKHAVTVCGLTLSGSFRGFVDDGLMTLFFLLIGLQLKLEWCEGRLSLNRKMILPIAAAIGGMVVPALIYVGVSLKQPAVLPGWAIPMATDIAFSLGVLSLFGRRIPIELTFFLMLLAILDDAGAVLVIGLFYSTPSSGVMLLLALVLMGILFVMGRTRWMNGFLWCIGGVLLWWCLWRGGLSPVLAGVLLAITMPAHGKGNCVTGLISFLHPWVAFGIMPLFALVNAGVSLHGGTISTDATTTLFLAIVAGLVLGKPLGVLGLSALLIRLRVTVLPSGVNWPMFVGVAFLCGIGFTMSLFIGTLAFDNVNAVFTSAVRQGVLLGSLLSGWIAATVLYLTYINKNRRKP